VTSRAGVAAVIVVFCAIAVTTLYPVVFVVATSLRTDDDYNSAPSGMPRDLTLDNIKRAWESARLGDYVLNSVIVVVAAVTVLGILSVLAGYALAQLRTPFGRPILAAVVACMILPPSVLMISIFKIVQDFGLLNERIGLILVYASLNLPFSVYLMTTYLRGMPGELVEAARVDGAGTLRTMWSVAVPLIRPGIATLATLNFLVLWNELLFSLILLQEDRERTLMVAIATLHGQYLTSVPTVAAGLLFSAIPPLLIFVLFQRNLVSGLTAGAVK
jgi:ABC-type glycerol-3-phosphate transport system permease component